MQHAFALNLNTETKDNSTTSGYITLPKHCLTSIVGSFRVDKDTGEIYGEYITAPFVSDPIPAQPQCGTPRPTHNPDQHLHLAAANNSNVVYADFGGPTAAQPTTAVESSGTKPRRGPKPKVRLNPHAAIIKVANAERAHWIEQAVMAGMYIAVESNNGRLNIKPGYVRKVITMAVISTDTIARNTAFRNHDMKPVSERYVRYLAAAGRVALGCVERHLACHPGEQQRLETKVLAPSSWGEEFDLDETDYIKAP